MQELIKAYKEQAPCEIAIKKEREERYPLDIEQQRAIEVRVENTQRSPISNKSNVDVGHMKIGIKKGMNGEYKIKASEVCDMSEETYKIEIGGSLTSRSVISKAQAIRKSLNTLLREDALKFISVNNEHLNNDLKITYDVKEVSNIELIVVYEIELLYSEATAGRLRDFSGIDLNLVNTIIKEEQMHINSHLNLLSNVTGDLYAYSREMMNTFELIPSVPLPFKIQYNHNTVYNGISDNTQPNIIESTFENIRRILLSGLYRAEDLSVNPGITLEMGRDKEIYLYNKLNDRYAPFRYKYNTEVTLWKLIKIPEAERFFYLKRSDDSLGAYSILDEIEKN